MSCQRAQAIEAGYAGLQALPAHWPCDRARNPPGAPTVRAVDLPVLSLNIGKLRENLRVSPWERAVGELGGRRVSASRLTLLTINAHSHALMSRYQQPGNEKRMLAILNEGAFDAWLSARPEQTREFMRAYPANWLTANPVQKSC